MFRGWQEQGFWRVGILSPPSLDGLQCGPTCPNPKVQAPHPGGHPSTGLGSTLMSFVPHGQSLSLPVSSVTCYPQLYTSPAPPKGEHILKIQPQDYRGE